MNTELRPRALPSDEDASGRSLGEREIAYVTEAIRSGTLASANGKFVRALEVTFADLIGVRFAVACSSGSGAMHAAIGALDLEPGDEVVTTPITDMGAIAPILYQGAIPVFADVDARTLNVTASTIEAVLSERTRAIVTTHVFGTPCDMHEIEILAERRNLPLVEDCAQALLARHRDRYVGTIGRAGAFSLHQSMHVTTGEGGIVVTNDEQLARRIRSFVNKASSHGAEVPEHEFLALNYRMSELQGAVGIAQLEKLERAVERRVLLANIMTKWLDIPGIRTPVEPLEARSCYWRYAIRLDPSAYPGGPTAFSARLKERGVVTMPRYTGKPAFEHAVIRDRRTLGTSGWPLTLARAAALDHRRERFRGTYEGLDGVLVLPWNDRLTIGNVEHIARSIIATAKELRA